MKVLQVPFSFPPDPVGGTEVYVSGLARELAAAGVDVVVAAPGSVGRYVHAGLPVWRFSASPGGRDAREVYDEGDADAARAFGAILDAEGPDVVHFHALTRAVSLRALRETVQRGVRSVFTYHTPTVSCQRGSLLRWGREVCDGALVTARCSACVLHAAGVNRATSHVLARAPAALGRALERAGLSGGPWTALRMSALVGLRHTVVRAFLGEVDRLVVLCRWARDLLVRNGIAPAKIVVSPHGLTFLPEPARPRPTSAPPPLRVAYLGRLHPVKGVHVLIRAIRLAPDLPVELTIHGIAQGEDGETYRAELTTAAADDRRIRFQAPLPAAEVVAAIGRHHVLAVPSQWLETGPLVVHEAFAAGAPVVGSALGGIAELVRPGVDGVLVEPASSSEAWRGVLARLAGDTALLERLRSGIRPPRSMRCVAREMQAVYASVLAAPDVRSTPEIVHASG